MIDDARTCEEIGGKWIKAHFDRNGNLVHAFCSLGNGFGVIQSNATDQTYINAKLLLEQRKTNELLRKNILKDSQEKKRQELEALNCPENYIAIPGYYKKGAYVHSHCRKASEMSKDEKKIIKMTRRRR
jgi:hypothetical protein